jgi:hypothetical protein
LTYKLCAPSPWSSTSNFPYANLITIYDPSLGSTELFYLYHLIRTPLSPRQGKTRLLAAATHSTGGRHVHHLINAPANQSKITVKARYSDLVLYLGCVCTYLLQGPIRRGHTHRKWTGWVRIMCRCGGPFATVDGRRIVTQTIIVSEPRTHRRLPRLFTPRRRWSHKSPVVLWHPPPHSILHSKPDRGTLSIEHTSLQPKYAYGRDDVGSFSFSFSLSFTIPILAAIPRFDTGRSRRALPLIAELGHPNALLRCRYVEMQLSI